MEFRTYFSVFFFKHTDGKPYSDAGEKKNIGRKVKNWKNWIKKDILDGF